MGREVRRVPLDFKWPLNKTWKGFTWPETPDLPKCPDCTGGWSPFAQHLRDQFDGTRPFTPENPLTEHTPAVRAYAERNVVGHMDFYRSCYGIDNEQDAIGFEARRLARLWNGQWRHHLSQEDVDILLRDSMALHKLTHHWVRGQGWQKIEPPVQVTAEMVNELSITANLHFDCWALIKAYCAKEDVSYKCETCDGRGTLETYPGQRAEIEKIINDWQRTPPPAGEGWRLWETVTEGSPISPVFTTPEDLAQWMTTPAVIGGVITAPLTIEQARGFVGEGWAPTGFVSSDGQSQDGTTVVGTMAAQEAR